MKTTYIIANLQHSRCSLCVSMAEQTYKFNLHKIYSIYVDVRRKLNWFKYIIDKIIFSTWNRLACHPSCIELKIMCKVDNGVKNSGRNDSCSSLSRDTHSSLPWKVIYFISFYCNRFLFNSHLSYWFIRDFTMFSAWIHISLSIQDFY